MKVSKMYGIQYLTLSMSQTKLVIDNMCYRREKGKNLS